MILTGRALPRISLVFTGLLAGITCFVTACSSGEGEAGAGGPPVAHKIENLDSFCTYNPAIPLDGNSTRQTTAWKAMGGSNFKPFVDANTDLVCGVSLSTAGQVICYLPNSVSTPLVGKVTNWGVSASGVPIASNNSAPQGVAILKHTGQPAGRRRQLRHLRTARGQPRDGYER